MTMSKDEVVTILKSVVDKQTGKSIIQMGLVTSISVDREAISIIVTPRNPSCPIGLKMAYDAKVLLAFIPGVQKVNVTVKGHKHADEMNKMMQEL